MERTSIIREIMIRLDEILPPGESISHPFENHINSILDESYRQILNDCPVSLLPLKEITATVIYEPDDTFGEVDDLFMAYVPVPDDFIRLGLFKFENWKNPATKYITVESPQYKEVKTGFLAGGVVNPLVVLTHAKKGEDASPKRYLVCYKITIADSEEYLYYVYYDKDEGITALSDLVIVGLSWCAAAKFMQIFELPGVSLAEERYKQFIISNAK